MSFADTLRRLAEVLPSAGRRPQLKVVVNGQDLMELMHHFMRLDEDVRARYASHMNLITPRPANEYHEDFGPVLWWKFPVNEPPYVGNDSDCDWPGYHTHWTPILMPDKP